MPQISYRFLAEVTLKKKKLCKLIYFEYKFNVMSFKIKFIKFIKDEFEIQLEH